MNLYLVSFSDYSYDEYDSFLVVAATEEEAAQLVPDAQQNREYGRMLRAEGTELLVWPPKYSYLGRGKKSVTLIGQATSDLEWGDVPIASFNAG